MKKKVKTHKIAAKRFKISSRGKIFKTHGNSSHLKLKKSKSRLRRQKEPTLVSKADEKKIKRLLPN